MIDLFLVGCTLTTIGCAALLVIVLTIRTVFDI